MPRIMLEVGPNWSGNGEHWLAALRDVAASVLGLAESAFTLRLCQASCMLPMPTALLGPVQVTVTLFPGRPSALLHRLAEDLRARCLALGASEEATDVCLVEVPVGNWALPGPRA